jgi:D-tyrosyl-tRNA(Tyr) deacylase
MRAVVQIVKDCAVHVAGEAVAELGAGLLVYLGVSPRDTGADLDYMVNKIVNLRVFPDENGKMNKSLQDTGEGIIVISQFTLYGDVRKGRRPSYDDAASPGMAEKMYTAFLDKLRTLGFSPAAGKFQTCMEVRYTNRGPVTILVDSEKKF